MRAKRDVRGHNRRFECAVNGSKEFLSGWTELRCTWRIKLVLGLSRLLLIFCWTITSPEPQTFNLCKVQRSLLTLKSSIFCTIWKCTWQKRCLKSKIMTALSQFCSSSSKEQKMGNQPVPDHTQYLCLRRLYFIDYFKRSFIHVRQTNATAVPCIVICCRRKLQLHLILLYSWQRIISWMVA